MAGSGKNLAEVGEAAGASAVAGAIIGTFIAPGPGTLIGAGIGAIGGGIIAALGKTAPQVQNIATNAQDTANQLADLLKAIPREQNVEYSFIFDFINAVKILAKRANDYDTLIGSLQGSDQSNTDSASQITEAFATQVGTVEDFIAKFRTKNATGVYNSFVSHSKALAPVYLFMDDDIEDVEKSCQSLDAAIKAHSAAMKQIKAAVPPSSPGAATSKPQEQTNDTTKQPGNNQNPIIPPKDMTNVLKALQISNPNPKQVAFLQDIMNSTQ